MTPNDWTLQRNDTQATLRLHSQYVWADEYDWSALVQSEPQTTLTGAMDIQQGTKLADRPISLEGEETRITRRDIKTLRDWATVTELEMTLTHPSGQTYQVIFARPFISKPEPIKEYRPSDQSDDDKFRVNVYLMTI